MAQLIVVVLVDEALRTWEPLMLLEFLLAPGVLVDGLAINSLLRRRRCHTVVEILYSLLVASQLATLIDDFLRADELQIRRSWLVVAIAFSGLNSLQHVACAMLTEHLDGTERKGCNAHQLPAADGALRYNCRHFNFKLFE